MVRPDRLLDLMAKLDLAMMIKAPELYSTNRCIKLA